MLPLSLDGCAIPSRNTEEPWLTGTGGAKSRYQWFHRETPRGNVRKCAHGDHCACLVLAEAVGVNPDEITYEYCRSVLQKHWRLTCDHGQCPPRRALIASARWDTFGKLDTMKAMLLKEI